MLKRFHIPIFNATLIVSVSRDVLAARAKFNGMFGEYTDECYALCSNNGGGYVGLFLPTYCDENRRAHEIFHATHRILEWTNCNFDSSHHETGAMLNGYLTELVASVYAKLPQKGKGRR